MGVYPVANLRQIREKKYKKMTDFIPKTKLSRSTIGRAESGQIRVSNTTIK